MENKLMLKKILRNKFLAITFTAVLLSSFNLCGFENVISLYHGNSPSSSSGSAECAAHGHSHHAQSGSSENSSEKDSDSSLCCADLVAIQNNSKIDLKPNFLRDFFQEMDALSSIFVWQKVRDQVILRPDFLHGHSPPSFFLPAQPTHAPPVIFQP
jgi:hypothetical protein